MDEQQLVDKFRTMYDQDKLSYAACILRHGKRPELTGETPEQRDAQRLAMEAWDLCFENDL